MSDTNEDTKTGRADPVQTRITSDGPTGWTVAVGGDEFTLTALPVAIVSELAARGLRDLMLRAKDRSALYASLKAGTPPMTKAPKGPKMLDAWRTAIAFALVDEQAKAGGVKAKSPEFAALVEAETARAWDYTRENLVAAKKIPAVVAHWSKITKAGNSVSSLFGGSEGAEAA